MKYDIFISYRREGGGTMAQLVYERLRARGYRVFLDIKSLRSGKYNKKLLEVIAGCEEVLVILSPNALDRCCDPDDWVHRELAYAISKKKTIIPILMNGFSWPEQLPDTLRELPNYQGVQDSKDYFDAVMDKLCEVMHCRPHPLRARLDSFCFGIRRMSDRLFNRTKRSPVMIVVFGLLLALVFGMGGIGVRDYVRRTVVTVNLTSDYLSVAEFNKMKDVVKTRLDEHLGRWGYRFEANDGWIRLRMPLETYKKMKDIDNLYDYAFIEQMSMPVEWEMVRSAKHPGVYQVNYDELSGEQIVLQYSMDLMYASEGGYVDTVTTIKKRLDALEMPYAFGKTVTGPYDISIRTSAEHMSPILADEMFRGYPQSFLEESRREADMYLDCDTLRIANPFTESEPKLYDSEITCAERSDGTYAFQVVGTNAGAHGWNQMVDEILESGNPNLYLYYNDYILSQMDVREREEEIRSGRIVFEDFSNIGMERVDRDGLYVLQYLKAFAETGGADVIYRCRMLQENPERGYGLVFTETRPMEQRECQSIVDEVLTGAQVHVYHGQINILLEHKNLIDEVPPTKLVELIKTAYEEFGLSQGLCSLHIYRENSWEFAINVEPDASQYHMPVLDIWAGLEVSIEGSEWDGYWKELFDLLENDSFFDTELRFVMSEYYREKLK